MKFQFSDLTFISKTFKVTACEIGISDFKANEIIPQEQKPGYEGFLIRGLPSEEKQKKIKFLKKFIIYTPAQYTRYYINLTSSFENYLTQFGSKTRSTLRRKVKKFEKQCDNKVNFKVYKTADDLIEFYSLARGLSSTTYQENLLDSGIPANKEFVGLMCEAGSNDQIRGFLLFHKDTAVSYLYLSSKKGVLMYDYLGYRPDYMKWSVGTVLHYYAIEYLFNEQRFKTLDFTEGEGQQKKLFGNNNIKCVNLLYLNTSLKNFSYITLHAFTNWLSFSIGSLLDNIGLKAKIKKFIRFGI